jgi:uncharacterized repeat protein (TIGR01451 family)
VPIGPQMTVLIGARIGAPKLSSNPTTLTVAISDSADPVITSDAYSYSVQVTNTGANTANGVTCAVQLPANATFVSGSGAGWTVVNFGAGLIRASLPSLAVGPATAITINVTSSAAAETSNATADASASNAPPAVQGTQATVVKLVAKDATSGIRVPATATQWSDFRSIKGLSVASPDSLWLCQDASGNLADAIGALPLTATAVLNYQQAVAGWSRLGVFSTDAGSGKAVLPAATGPTPATTSQTWMFIMSMPATPAANRIIGGLDTPSSTNGVRWLHLTGTGFLRFNVVGVNTDGAVNMSSGVHVFLVKYDRTNSAAVTYTDLEKIVGTYAATALDGDKGLGNAGGGTSSARGALYGCLWTAGNGEISDANVKAMLQAMGFAIAWS